MRMLVGCLVFLVDIAAHLQNFELEYHEAITPTFDLQDQGEPWELIAARSFFRRSFWKQRFICTMLYQSGQANHDEAREPNVESLVPLGACTVRGFHLLPLLRDAFQQP